MDGDKERTDMMFLLGLPLKGFQGLQENGIRDGPALNLFRNLLLYTTSELFFLIRFDWKEKRDKGSYSAKS